MNTNYGKANRSKTVCLHGHPFDEANTYTDRRGRRHCRLCHRDREDRRRTVTRPPIEQPSQNVVMAVRAQSAEVTDEYLAGFFDGEGHISILRTKLKKSGRLKFWLRVGVCNSDPRVVIEFKRRFGGSLHLRQPRSEKHSVQQEWIAQHRVAESFLNRLLPFLIVKRRDAEIGLEFQALVRYYPKMGHKREALDAAEIDQREALRGQMLLKHGLAARAPVN